MLSKIPWEIVAGGIVIGFLVNMEPVSTWMDSMWFWVAFAAVMILLGVWSYQRRKRSYNGAGT